jgi:hypothetical protein
MTRERERDQARPGYPLTVPPRPKADDRIRPYKFTCDERRCSYASIVHGHRKRRGTTVHVCRIRSCCHSCIPSPSWAYYIFSFCKESFSKDVFNSSPSSSFQIGRPKLSMTANDGQVILSIPTKSSCLFSSIDMMVEIYLSLLVLDERRLCDVHPSTLGEIKFSFWNRIIYV